MSYQTQLPREREENNVKKSVGRIVVQFRNCTSSNYIEVVQL